MRRLLVLAAAFAAAPLAAAPPAPLVSGLKNPESVAVGPDGKVYVSVIGEFGKDGDGAVLVVAPDGSTTPAADGLDDPKGVAVFQKFVYVADRTRVLRIEPGKVSQFAPANAFPTQPTFLNDVAVDPESGTVYVSDCGDFKGNGGAIYRISPNGVVSLVADPKRSPGLVAPNGLALDGASFLMVADAGTGDLLRVRIADGFAEKVGGGLGLGDGLAWDQNGRLFASDWRGGKVFGVNRPGDQPVLVAEGFQSAADIGFDAANQRLLVPDMKAGTVTAIPAVIPGKEVDTTLLPVETALAFPDLKWTGWEPETPDGKSNAFRPVLLTHAGDGSNRVFVGDQRGTVHVFPNDPKAKATKVFLDLSAKTRYDDKAFEEGLIGLAFHPDYKKTGEFFVFYTPKAEKLVNVIARFRVSKDDPDRADPASEEEVIRFQRPFWNHDGGTLAFGPDGMLYTVTGDGGAGNDPFDNGQNTNVLLGKMLRIDVNGRDPGKNYAVPKDNPFAGKTGQRPEVWAYGLRNVWRFAFDRPTGNLWAADVGQNLYEEINLIRRGGNYGWNRREGLHPFGARGSGPSDQFIDPIWEYHHDVGRSITGGFVYRGSKLPQLAGHYLYADFVSAKLWGLKYDEKAGRVVANRPITDRKRPVMSFGEDEKGEAYLLSTATDGKGVFTLVGK